MIRHLKSGSEPNTYEVRINHIYQTVTAECKHSVDPSFISKASRALLGGKVERECRNTQVYAPPGRKQ